MPAPTPFAEFLRARREALTPAEVGLRSGGRRRTPGLRREELATLAGVSIDYLVRIEQGRDTNPSAEVVTALADALQLTGDERHHLFRLAAHASKPEMCPDAPALVDTVPATVQHILDGLDPTPAFVLGPLNDVVAGNDTWAALAGPLGYDAHPNLARHLFLGPTARDVHPDWEAAADEQAAHLRMAAIVYADAPALQQLLADLDGAAGFAERWAAHGVAEKRRGPKRVVHPEAGELRFASEVLGLAEHDQRLVTWIPADTATAAAVAGLTGSAATSPAALRLVGG